MTLSPLVLAGALLLPGASPGPRGGTPPIGYCTALEKLDAARAAGFDYLELRTSEIAALAEDAFERLAADLRRTGTEVPVTYLFIPREIKITGPAVDEVRQMGYVRGALERVARLGAETVVFGSGPARHVPDGFPKQQAFQQLVGFCKRIAPEARARGIVVAIEPQRKQECNIVNSVAEGLELVRAVDDPAIQLTVDFYHLAEEKEDAAIVVEAGPHVRHVHFANPSGRVFPLDPGEFDYAPFFDALRRIGYVGRISLEARSSHLATEAPRSIAFLRRALER